MSSEEKLEQSEIAKSKGTDYFKKENYKQAKKLYKKVITFLENETDLEEEKKKKRNNLMLAAHLNIALCEIKMANYSEAKQHCNKALEIDPNNVKAFFRRGTCFFNVNDYEPALDDYNKVLQIEPDNEAARNHAINCHQLQQFKEKDKLIYDRMFSRFTAQDPCDLTLKTAKQLINRSKEPIPVLVQTQTLKDLLPLRSTRHMSCLRDDQVWVSDNYGNLVLFDSKGSKLDKLEVDIFADDGFHTVTDDGELIFTDETNKLINKVSVDKKIQVIIRTDKWTPESVFCSPVTGKLIVGLRREEYRFTKEGKAKVEIYSRTYNLLRIIKTDEEGNDLYGDPLYITENINGDICVSDWKRKAVVVVDFIGRHKFSYSGHSSDPFFHPSGLSPDIHGRLAIYNSQTRTVHLIDMYGNFLGFLLDSIPFPRSWCFKVAGPIGLCWDKKCNLWIGEYVENSLQIYSYRLNKSN